MKYETAFKHISHSDVKYAERIYAWIAMPGATQVTPPLHGFIGNFASDCGN
ncbi:MAG: hypothetical protein ABTQ25_10645 [Nitrosomonas ureae]